MLLLAFWKFFLSCCFKIARLAHSSFFFRELVSFSLDFLNDLAWFFDSQMYSIASFVLAHIPLNVVSSDPAFFGSNFQIFMYKISCRRWNFLHLENAFKLFSSAWPKPFLFQRFSKWRLDWKSIFIAVCCWNQVKVCVRGPRFVQMEIAL